MKKIFSTHNGRFDSKEADTLFGKWEAKINKAMSDTTRKYYPKGFPESKIAFRKDPGFPKVRKAKPVKQKEYFCRDCGKPCPNNQSQRWGKTECWIPKHTLRVKASPPIGEFPLPRLRDMCVCGKRFELHIHPMQCPDGKGLFRHAPKSKPAELLVLIGLDRNGKPKAAHLTRGEASFHKQVQRMGALVKKFYPDGFPECQPVKRKTKPTTPKPGRRRNNCI